MLQITRTRQPSNAPKSALALALNVAWLQGMEQYLTVDNWKDVMIASLGRLHPDTVAGFFADCHYFVEGKPYKPYLHF
jgi:hypothetical protein